MSALMLVPKLLICLFVCLFVCVLLCHVNESVIVSAEEEMCLCFRPELESGADADAASPPHQRRDIK